MRRAGIRLHPLTARQQLALQARWPALLPRLVRAGLSLPDARAVAYNTTLLFYALRPRWGLWRPADVLRRFSLRRIARLCRRYAELEDQSGRDNRNRRRCA